MKIMKKKFCALIILCMLISIIVPIHVAAASKIKLNKKTITIEAGKTYTLVVRGSKQKVKWKSSDKKVAKVNANGKVTGKKPGTVKITAKVGKKTLKCTVKVKPILSANKTNLTIALGAKAKVKVTLRASATVSYKIKSGKNVVSCSWGKFKKNTVPLTIKAKAKGTATIVISNTYNKEKVKIYVIVPGAGGISNSNNNNTNATTTVNDTNIQGPNPWEGVEVVIPKTIGEQSNPSNRMEITNYSFYNAPYSGASYYYMNYRYKLVEYGKTSRSTWGEYFYCYDKNRNILKKCYMYASSLALNRTYVNDVMLPLETAKIVFMEYPNIVNEPETNEPETNKPVTTEENVSKLIRYIISNGSMNKGYKHISNTYISGRNTITSTITYRNDINMLIFHSVCNNNIVVSFDYDIKTFSSCSDLVFSYINNAMIEARVPFDISTYTYDTNLKFDITMKMLTSNTEEEIQEFANQHARLAVSAWGLLVAQKTGLSLSDIGFTLYDSNLR